MAPKDWLPIAQRLHALACTGLAFSKSDYDLERYEEIKSLSMQMLSSMANIPIEHIIRLFPAEIGYVTPKVDIRAIVFRGADELLMVQEREDSNRWAVPGGWADVGYSPFEVAEKEVREETGLVVKATRLLAVFDKKKHEHPAQPWYVYKFFILCEVNGGLLLSETNETSGVAWIKFRSVLGLPVSTDRVTLSQLEKMFLFAENPHLPTLCD